MSEKNPDVIEMVRAYLAANGFDGLCAEGGECACLADDLAPCGEIQGDCFAGFKHSYPDRHCENGMECEGDCVFHIGTERQTEENRTEHQPASGEKG